MDQEPMQSSVMETHRLFEQIIKVLDEVKSAMGVMATSLDDFESRLIAVEKAIKDLQQ